MIWNPFRKPAPEIEKGPTRTLTVQPRAAQFDKAAAGRLRNGQWVMTLEGLGILLGVLPAEPAWPEYIGADGELIPAREAQPARAVVNLVDADGMNADGGLGRVLPLTDIRSAFIEEIPRKLPDGHEDYAQAGHASADSYLQAMGYRYRREVAP